MNEAHFSPAPWRNAGLRNGEPFSQMIIRDAESVEVGTVIRRGDGLLIEAAPEIFRAAVLAEGLLKVIDPESNARKALTHALAKARGDSREEFDRLNDIGEIESRDERYGATTGGDA